MQLIPHEYPALLGFGLGAERACVWWGCRGTCAQRKAVLLQADPLLWGFTLQFCFLQA